MEKRVNQIQERSKMHNPPQPGEVLKVLYLDELGLTITATSKALGVSRQNLSEIINGHTGITPEMALKLAKALNTSASMWLKMQQHYDLWQAEKNSNSACSNNNLLGSRGTTLTNNVSERLFTYWQ